MKRRKCLHLEVGSHLGGMTLLPLFPSPSFAHLSPSLSPSSLFFPPIPEAQHSLRTEVGGVGVVWRAHYHPPEGGMAQSGFAGRAFRLPPKVTEKPIWRPKGSWLTLTCADSGTSPGVLDMKCESSGLQCCGLSCSSRSAGLCLNDPICNLGTTVFLSLAGSSEAQREHTMWWTSA